MTDIVSIVSQDEIQNRIYSIRGLQVMLDSHLAEMYHVETKQLNRAVKRNENRFPEKYMFQLTENEWENLRCQIGTSSSEYGGRRYFPYVFNEQGVAMLSAVLNSEIAIKVSIQIMNTFVEMRKIVLGNAALFQRLDKIELKQIETEQKFEEVFKALENKEQQPEKGIFFDGQIFDAYIFIAEIIKKAEKSIVLIDNYIDESVLTLFTKRKNNVNVIIYTKQISKQLQLDLEKYNSQYPTLDIRILNDSHDRFLIIDEKELYHIGASLKDLGKKWFAFSKMVFLTTEILKKL